MAWGLLPTIAGVAIGLTGAVGLSRSIQTLLFEASPTDFAAYAGVSLLLIVAALAACYVPVRSLTSRAEPRRFLQ